MDPAVVERWHDFYLTLGGASAALVGLLFVGLSIHLRRVIRQPEIRALARQAFAGFLNVLITSLFVLIPMQDLRYLGLELVLLAVFSLVEMFPRVRSLFRRRSRVAGVQLPRFLYNGAAYLLLLGVGIALFLGQSDGLYWLVAVVLILLVLAARNAWDLLVQVGEEPEPRASEKA